MYRGIGNHRDKRVAVVIVITAINTNRPYA